MTDSSFDLRAGRITRAFIEANTVSRHRTAGGTRPDLLEVKAGGQSIAVKDFMRSDPLFRLIVGPILIRREYGALRKLAGLRGVPGIICRIDRYALAMEHVRGRSADQVKPGELGPEFYEELMRVVEGMHARGVAHCDLRSRGNFIVGDDGLPCIVDFAACVYRGRGINPLTRWLFSQFAAADRNAVLVLKQRISPELLTDADRAELARPLPFERPAKAFGQAVRRLTRRLLTSRNKRDTAL